MTKCCVIVSCCRNWVEDKAETQSKGAAATVTQHAPLLNSASQWRIAGSTDGIVHIWVHIPVLAWPSGIWTHPIIPGSWLQLCWGHGHAGSRTGQTGPFLIWRGSLSVKHLLRLSGRTLNRKQKSADYLQLNCFEEIVGLFIPEKRSWVVSWWLANACKCWHNSCFWG